MPAIKTENLPCRIAPAAKAALREAAARKHCSSATVLEVMIRGYPGAGAAGAAHVNELQGAQRHGAAGQQP